VSFRRANIGGTIIIIIKSWISVKNKEKMADYSNLSSIKSLVSERERENETSSERDKKRKYLVCAKRKKNHWHNNEVIVNVYRMDNYQKCHFFLSLSIKVCCVFLLG